MLQDFRTIFPFIGSWFSVTFITTIGDLVIVSIIIITILSGKCGENWYEDSFVGSLICL